MDEKRREFPALQRRRRYVEQELYTYDKYLRTKEMDANQQTRAALDADAYAEELNELDYVLRYFDRLGNGYHLSQWQWAFLVALVTLAAILATVAVLR